MPALAVAQVRATEAALTDQRIFEQATRSPDPEARIPASDLLTGLRGKDVLVVFVESYGQVAVHGASFSPGIDAVLRQRQRLAARAGLSAQSAWVTSPTFGGISWLAHSTLQSGLWVNSRQRYASSSTATGSLSATPSTRPAGAPSATALATDDAAGRPARQFYHFDQLYDRSNVGYHGPTFSYAQMPDQYILSAFQRLELAPGHKPVMAEIDTVSSHSPWAPLPTMVPWNKVGNGSIFDPMPAESEIRDTVWHNASKHAQGLRHGRSSTRCTSSPHG